MTQRQLRTLALGFVAVIVGCKGQGSEVSPSSTGSAARTVAAPSAPGSTAALGKGRLVASSLSARNVASFEGAETAVPGCPCFVVGKNPIVDLSDNPLLGGKMISGQRTVTIKEGEPGYTLTAKTFKKETGRYFEVVVSFDNQGAEADEVNLRAGSETVPNITLMVGATAIRPVAFSFPGLGLAAKSYASALDGALGIKLPPASKTSLLLLFPTPTPISQALLKIGERPPIVVTGA